MVHLHHGAAGSDRTQRTRRGALSAAGYSGFQ